MSEQKMHRRFPARLFRTGDEPDPRFSLANERTLLSWLRTALALIAAGIALEMLADGLHPGLRVAAALVLTATGMSIPLLAWQDWMRTERAMRHRHALPAPTLAVAVGAAIVVAGGLVVVGIFA